MCVWSLFCCAVLSVLSGFAFISLGKKKLVTLLNLSSWRHFTVSVLYLFLALSWVGLKCIAFPDDTHLRSLYSANLFWFQCFYTVLAIAVLLFQLTFVSDLLLQPVTVFNKLQVTLFSILFQLLSICDSKPFLFTDISKTFPNISVLYDFQPCLSIFIKICLNIFFNCFNK